MMAARSDRWSDLGTRIISAAVLLAVGAAALWTGGVALISLIAAIAGLCMWETARMTSSSDFVAPILVGLLAALCVMLAWWMKSPLAPLLVMVPLTAGLALDLRTRLFAIFSLEIMFGAFGVAKLADMNGPLWVLWLVALVAASDIMGYFAGRAIGGPKLWTAISPKKTWSGTIAGWLGAAAVGLAFAPWLVPGHAIWLVGLSLVLAMAGQAGDLAESALKRAVGVKDSSRLIPGHGGVFDRFDALLGAGVLVLFIISFGRT